MVVSESTGSTLEVAEMQEACTTTGSSSTNTILVTSVRSVCATSTSSATNSTVPLSTSTSSGPWSHKTSKTRQPRILCPWLMSLSLVTSRFLVRGFCLRSNPLLSRPSLCQRLLRRRLRRLVELLFLQPRLCSFPRFWLVLKLNVFSDTFGSFYNFYVFSVGKLGFCLSHGSVLWLFLILSFV